MLPCLYVSLHTGKKTNPERKDAPKLYPFIRDEERFIPTTHANLLVEPPKQTIYLLTKDFSLKLDQLLRRSPKTVASTIHDAVFAYYVFERIHPFSDGNGRVGRLIMKRIIQGAGLRDPLFHYGEFFEKSYTEHDRAMKITHESNDLSALEVWLATRIKAKYDPIKDRKTYQEIEYFINIKQKQVSNKSNGRLLSDVWEGFEGIRIYNNNPNLHNY